MKLSRVNEKQKKNVFQQNRYVFQQIEILTLSLQVYSIRIARELYNAT